MRGLFWYIVYGGVFEISRIKVVVALKCALPLSYLECEGRRVGIGRWGAAQG
jgi:hypothetical protein